MNFWSDPEETTLEQRFYKLIFQIKSQTSLKAKESLKLLREEAEMERANLYLLIAAGMQFPTQAAPGSRHPQKKPKAT